MYIENDPAHILWQYAFQAQSDIAVAERSAVLPSALDMKELYCDESLDTIKTGTQDNLAVHNHLNMIRITSFGSELQ